MERYLYLAHPFPTRQRMRKWELKVENKTGLSLFNPFYDIDRKDVKEIDLGRRDRYKLNPASVVNADIKKIKESTGLIGYVDGSLSYGTIMEIVYAFNYQVPVYLIITNGHHNHPWFRYHATKIFTGLEDFEKWAQKELQKVMG